MTTSAGNDGKGTSLEELVGWLMDASVLAEATAHGPALTHTRSTKHVARRRLRPRCEAGDDHN